MAEQLTWIVTRYDSCFGEIDIEYLYGTENQIRRYLLKLEEADACKRSHWDSGPARLSDIDKYVSDRNVIKLSTGNVFSEWQIYYTAMTTPLPVAASYVLELISDGETQEIAPEIARDKSYF